jgi:hypothetical protein
MTENRHHMRSAAPPLLPIAHPPCCITEIQRSVTKRYGFPYISARLGAAPPARRTVTHTCVAQVEHSLAAYAVPDDDGTVRAESFKPSLHALVAHMTRKSRSEAVEQNVDGYYLMQRDIDQLVKVAVKRLGLEDAMANDFSVAKCMETLPVGLIDAIRVCSLGNAFGQRCASLANVRYGDANSGIDLRVTRDGRKSLQVRIRPTASRIPLQFGPFGRRPARPRHRCAP